MESKPTVNHARRNLIIKLIICVNFLILLVGLAVTLIGEAKDNAKFDSIGHRVKMCDSEYYDGDIAWLRKYLGYYDAEYEDMDDEVFDVYREVVKAYEDFATWRTWYGCLGTELDAEAQIREPEFREAVYANAMNCVDVRNQKKLDNLVEEMEAMMAVKVDAYEEAN